MSRPSLSYFSARGIIEPLRLLLEDAKVDFEKKELGAFDPVSDSFKSLKGSGVLDFGSVPLWEEDDLKLVQSSAISRYIARKYVIHALIEGYIGENEKEAGRVDAVIEGVKDFLEILRHFAMAPSDQHETMWINIQKNDIPKWLNAFESILKKNKTGFFVGNKMTVADFYVYDLLDELTSAKIEISSYPLLLSFHSLISRRPNIQSCISNPSRYPPNLAG